ncbi:MAG: hypothetical protein KatS3mg031_2281 [Chitinophagales bacterium]|nr:MAG: hypothetical protein KatS3mg031_2281 [Chitinophagales bacterium]
MRLFCIVLILSMAAFFSGMHTLTAQTLAAPVIRCVTTNEQTGDVTISWVNPPPETCGPFIGYVLYAGTSPAGPFFILDTLTNPTQTTYQHTGANGTILDWYYFLITLYDCPGYVSDSSAIVQEQPLITPELHYVTVLPDGRVEIHWYPTPSVQAEGYIIYYDLGGGSAMEIDTVYGPTSTTYIDTGADPLNGSVTYTIAAFDACGNKTLFSNKPHRTLYLTASSQPCAQQVYLQWNLYINWPSVTAYQLETSMDKGPFTVAGSFQSPNYYYSLAGISADSICFRIAALHPDGTTRSLSNEVCLKYDLIRSTQYIALRRLSVNVSGSVDVEWYVDSLADINAYHIYRSSDATGFTVLDSQMVSTPAFFNAYADASALTSQQSYYYQVSSRDDCAFVLTSGAGRTIHLSVTSQPPVNRMVWNAFELEHATVLQYTVYREDNGTLVPLQTVGNSVQSYDDPVSSGIANRDEFCYVVEATYRLTVPGLPEEELRSASNRACTDLPPVIHVPNAFVPDGKNNVFKPVLLNPNVAEYEFRIFDRWGKELFVTSQVNNGWDGTSNGEALPLGGYTYYIRAVSFSGATAEKKGIVVLIR